MDLNEAAVFVKVVQAGSFSAAARQLGQPTSTVSTRVARLEKHLNVTLLQRTTRRLSLTEMGDLYFRHASLGMEHLLEAKAAVEATMGEPQGLLRVTAPADLGDADLARLISGFRQAYPKIRVELILRNQYVDLIAEAVDVAIRTGPLQDSSLIARQVGVACWAPFTSPNYLRRAPPLNEPQHLRQHLCVMFTPFGKDHWTLYNAQGSITVPLEGHIIANNISVIKSIILAGEGIALLPTYQCRSASEEGKLVRLLPEWYARTDPIHLVYPRQKYVSPKLRVFVDRAALELQSWFA